jgi:hypothetical protein
MKEALSGRFSSAEEVNGALQSWLKMQLKIYFSDGI